MITELESISLASINDDLSPTSLPLKFYLEQALDRLPPLNRLIIVVSEKFAWSKEKIINYLEQQGDIVSLADVEICLREGYQILETNLPSDIRAIYLS